MALALALALVRVRVQGSLISSTFFFSGRKKKGVHPDSKAPSEVGSSSSSSATKMEVEGNEDGASSSSVVVQAQGVPLPPSEDEKDKEEDLDDRAYDPDKYSDDRGMNSMSPLLKALEVKEAMSAKREDMDMGDDGAQRGKNETRTKEARCANKLLYGSFA